MKGTQREHTIRDEAARRLCEDLRIRPGVAATRHSTECRVIPNSTQGRGQADAVVASLMADKTHYTIAIEAKSIRTLRALRGKSGRAARILASIFVTMVTGIIAAQVIESDSRVPIAIALSFGVFSAVLLVFRSSRTFSTPAAVLPQLLRYPANEHWIALPQDAIVRSGRDFDDLLADCSAAGVGLLGVTRRRVSKVHLAAKQDRCRGPKLPEYSKGSQLLQELSKLQPCSLDHE